MFNRRDINLSSITIIFVALFFCATSINASEKSINISTSWHGGAYIITSGSAGSGGTGSPFSVGYWDVFGANNRSYRGFAWFTIPSEVRNSTITSVSFSYGWQSPPAWNDLLRSVDLYHLGSMSWSTFSSKPKSEWYGALSGVSYQDSSYSHSGGWDMSTPRDLEGKSQIGFSWRASPEIPSGFWGSSQTNYVNFSNPKLSIAYTVPDNGECGSSDGQTFTSSSISNRCNVGSASGVTSHSSQYTWNCYGIDGGSTDYCSATRAYRVTPSAGSGGSISPSSTQTVGYNQTKSFTIRPYSGYTAAASGCGGSSTSRRTSSFTYTTGSIRSSCTVSATFTPIVNGVCGPSNGQTLTRVPTTNLCTSNVGIISVHTNTGSYTWSCSGNAGGSSQSCSATRGFTVSPSAGSGGSISPSSTQTVGYNQTKSFTVKPNSEYTASVGGTCGGSPSSGTSQFTYTTNAITGNCTVSVTFTADAFNGQCGSLNGQTLTSAPSGAGLCSTGSDAGVTTNTGNYTWSCSGSNGGTNDSCSATRAYTVEPSAGSGGTISPNTSQSAAYNQTKQFTITPNSGYTASIGGTCGGSPSSGTSQFSYTTNAIIGNCTVSATFTQNLPTYTLIVSSNGDGTGEITSNPVGIDCGGDCSQSYTSGTQVTLTASAHSGSSFSSWSGCNSTSGNQCYVTMSSGKSVTASFIEAFIPDITVTPTTVPFGIVNIGFSLYRTVAVNNSGNASLTIGTITNPAWPFSKVSDNCSGRSFAQSEGCTITLRFSPDFTGSYNNTFNIPSNDPDENPMIISLTGTGESIGPDIDVTPSTRMRFLNITPGVIATQTITVRNTGDEDLRIYSLTEPEATFSIVPGNDRCSNRTLAPGQTCTVEVQFTSDVPGVFRSKFRIPSDDPDENPVKIGLLGSATPVDNNEPTKPMLNVPANGATDVPTTFDFKWSKCSDANGDPLSYKLYYGTDPSFADATIQVAALENRQIYAWGSTGLLFFGIAFAGGIRNRKKIVLMMLMICIVMALSISCGSGGGGSSGGGGGSTPSVSNDITGTVSGLSSGTTYYWKVVTDDGNGGTNESDVRSFTTQ